MLDDTSSVKCVGYRLEIFVYVFTPLEIAVVAGRFYAHKIASRPYGLDDWLVVAALIGQIVGAIISICAVELGTAGCDLILFKTDPGYYTRLQQYFFIYSIWYGCVICLSKLAICALYRRLFPQHSVLITIYIIIGILVTTIVADLITIFASCQPLSAMWESPEASNAHCINLLLFYALATLPNIVTDLVMLMLPFPIIWRLQMATRFKTGLTFTFLVGSSGLVASIMRLWSFTDYRGALDGGTVERLIWTIAEPGAYLISACLVMYRPLLEKFSFSSKAPKEKDQPEIAWPRPDSYEMDDNVVRHARHDDSDDVEQLLNEIDDGYADGAQRRLKPGVAAPVSVHQSWRHA
ncbi:hypothetical protein M426DRAFT_147117 [Hypoxylon sp. CI-4A]|nr:hypothetical protein M426DRAFT_147117 [Hypoxylon sp. CI-4A]